MPDYKSHIAVITRSSMVTNWPNGILALIIFLDRSESRCNKTSLFLCEKMVMSDVLCGMHIFILYQVWVTLRSNWVVALWHCGSFTIRNVSFAFKMMEEKCRLASTVADPDKVQTASWKSGCDLNDQTWWLLYIFHFKALPIVPSELAVFSAHRSSRTQLA